jgi:hypothetical protein
MGDVRRTGFGMQVLTIVVVMPVLSYGVLLSLPLAGGSDAIAH